MKVALLAAGLALSAPSISAQTNVEITFRVDMNVQIQLGRFDPLADFVVVRGTINTWGCSDALSESDQEDGNYEITIQVSNHVIGTGEYKFNINCGQGDFGRWEDAISNRSYSITGTEPDTDGDGYREVVLDTVFFDDTVGGSDAEVAFEVDLGVQIATGRFDPATHQVFVRGGLNAWGCSRALEDPDGDGVYATEIAVRGHRIGAAQFKFNIGCDDFGYEDSIPNRRYNVTGNEPDADGDGFAEVAVPVVYFDDVAPGPPVEFLLRVDMTQPIEEQVFVPGDSTVHAGGTFNGWTCSAELVEDDENVYLIEIQTSSHPLGVGEYKFGIGCFEGGWEADIANRAYVVRAQLPDTDGDGFLEVTPPIAFYNALENPFRDVELIFQVDLSVLEEAGEFDPASQNVVARGDFNAWSCTPAMAPIGDGLYEVSVELLAATVGRGEFKFNIDCLETGWEDAVPNREYFIIGDETDADGDGLVEVRVGPFYFDGREPSPGVGPFLRGDCAQTGRVDISSGIFLLNFLFIGGEAPRCAAACDAGGDGRPDVTSAIIIFNFLFLGGSPPPAPSPECGTSALESDIALGCEDNAGCR